MMIGDFLKIAVCAAIVITSSSLSMLGVFEPESIERSEWHIYTVDSEGNVGESSSVTVDFRNYPYISYGDETNDNLKYAYWTGREWSVMTVDSVGTTPYTAIALDGNGYPHISYIKLEAFHHFSLMYARWDGNDWQIETVDFVGTLGGYETSMALDSQDRPHISYYQWNDETLKYAHRNESGWKTETVDSSGDVGFYSSIDVDSNDYPHISYSDETHYDLKYARWNGSAWIIETVDSYRLVGWYTSIAVDSKDNPHIAYLDLSPYSHLNHAYFDGTSWILETVDSARQVGFFASIALDSNDHPHVSYHDNLNVSLRYARSTGNEWTIEIVDGSSNVGYWTSLAIDSDDLPHISYLDSGNTDLRYATKAELQPTLPSVSLDIDPDTLNLKSKGRWIAAYLSTNASVHDIDISSILLQDALAPERYDYQDDTLMLKFDRQALIAILEVGDSVEIKMTGKWGDGSDFEAYDWIRVIDQGKG